MPSRSIAFAALLLLGSTFATAQTQSQIQTQINSACSTGGTVVMPASLTVTSTLNLTCLPATPPGTPNKPLLLKGSPTLLTCNTGGNACVAIGATTSGAGVLRDNLALSDVYLIGPGQTNPGSIGINILNSGGLSKLNHIRIDGFEEGLHVDGSSYLMGLINIDDIVIGVPNASTNIAVHLDGMVANIKFVNFGLSGWQRILLMDGSAGSGAGASFNSGYFNSTVTPGTAAVYIGAPSGGQVKAVNFTNIEDWETACPFMELGNGAWVTADSVAWWQNVRAQNAGPAIHIQPGATAWLKISGSAPGSCGPSVDLIKNESSTAAIWAASSDLQGKINYTTGGQGMFVGNRCGTGDSTTNSFVGVTTNIKSQGNLGTCPPK